jgi:galactokinase
MDLNSKIESLKAEFGKIFGGESKIYRAPGRVNLIGEHTDYNDGFVMPAAIDRYTWMAVASRNDRRIRIHSTLFSETVEFDPYEENAHREDKWTDYPRGVAVTLAEAGKNIQGSEMLIDSDVPIGAGLSSSAAIETAVGFALLDQANISIDRTDLAKLCQRAENEFVGVRSGIMDQFTACHGQSGKALKLDCRSLDYETLLIPESIGLVICNTMVKHQLAGGEYNKRREECEEGLRILAQSLSGIRALRDVTIVQLETLREKLPETVYRRCRHVVTENDRVLKAATAFKNGDVKGFGKLMYQSHESLRNDYEVSCPELDLMAELARSFDGVYGARMTGGGFGGCTVNLVDTKRVEDFKKNISDGYEKETRLKPEIYVCLPAQGVEHIAEGRTAVTDRK